jgi:RNA polymerase sigma-70 factor (ECF subfamily)
VAAFSVKDPPSPASHEGLSRAESPPADRPSAADLFRAHAAFVARFAARLGVPHGEVEDVVQEVFLTVHRVGGFRPGQASVTTWLADLAVRAASTRRRSARRNRVVTDEDVLRAAVSAAPSPEELADLRADLEKAERALASLDLDRRAVFVLYELEGESCEAIAAGLSVPIGTVYSRLHAARKAFRAAFSSIEEGPARAALAGTRSLAKGEAP